MIDTDEIGREEKKKKRGEKKSQFPLHYVFSRAEFFIAFILNLEPVFDCAEAQWKTELHALYSHERVYVMLNCIELCSIHLSILARLFYLYTLFHSDNGGLLFFNTKHPA